MEVVKNWALERIGYGYIYGAKGQKCSVAFREKQAEQYPAQAGNILGTGAKWDGVPVWDCAQLVRYAWKQAGIDMVSGATSQWKKTDWERFGPVDGMPADAVACVYRERDGVMQHTGIYIGDGTVVHAKGTASGVVREKLGAYPWTHYGIPKGGENVLYQAIVQAENGLPVKMRQYADKGSHIVTKVECGQLVDVIGEDGVWCAVRYGSDKGFMMREFLRRADGSEPVQPEPEPDSGTFPTQEKIAALEREMAKVKERLDAVEQLFGEG